jgi:hypothetical protein
MDRVDKNLMENEKKIVEHTDIERDGPHWKRKNLEGYTDTDGIKNGKIRGDTQRYSKVISYTDRQQADLISLFHFFEISEVAKKEQRLDFARMVTYQLKSRKMNNFSVHRIDHAEWVVALLEEKYLVLLYVFSIRRRISLECVLICTIPYRRIDDKCSIQVFDIGNIQQSVLGVRF